MTDMTAQERERRWWKGITDIEPQLANEVARSSIETAIAHYWKTRPIAAKRKGKSPWAFSHQDAADMKERVEELKQEMQAYLPPPSAKAEFHLKVRKTVADLDSVAEYLEGLEWGAKKAARH